MITLEWSTRSDVGLRRRANEDSVIATPPVFAVADGMGGHAAGDVASALAVAGLSRLEGNLTATRREILEAIRAANDEISNRALDGETAGMGTTITGLAAIRNDAGADSVVVFNVGDSRSYLYRDNVLTQISHDHSVVQELVDEGTIAPEDAERHPERNVITRSLGAGTPLDIDWWILSPAIGDRFLLCSDGLFKDTGVAAIERLLHEHSDRETLADALLDAALAAGGLDNISLVLVDVLAIAAVDETDLLDEDTQPGAGSSDTDEVGDGDREADVDADVDGGDSAIGDTASGDDTRPIAIDAAMFVEQVPVIAKSPELSTSGTSSRHGT